MTGNYPTPQNIIRMNFTILALFLSAPYVLKIVDSSSTADASCAYGLREVNEVSTANEGVPKCEKSNATTDDGTQKKSHWG